MIVVSCFQAAIFGAPAQQVPADTKQPATAVYAESSDSDEQPQIVDLQDATEVGQDVSKHNTIKSPLG